MEKFILILLIVLNVGTIFAFPGQVFIGNPVIARGDRKIDSIYNFYGSPPSSELNISKFQIFHVKNVTVHEDCDQILQDLSSQTFQDTLIVLDWDDSDQMAEYQDCRNCILVRLAQEQKAPAVLSVFDWTEDSEIQGVDMSITIPNVMMRRVDYQSLFLTYNATTSQQVTLFPTSEDYFSGRSTQIGYYFFYIVMTSIVFGLLSIWCVYKLIEFLRFGSILDNPLLFGAYLFVLGACLERFLYHAIDWRGYMGIISKRAVSILDDGFGNTFFISFYSLLLTSWLSLAPQNTFWTWNSQEHKKKLFITAAIFNAFLYVSMIILLFVFLDDDKDAVTTLYLGVLTLLMVVGVSTLGSRMLWVFKSYQKLSQSQRQFRRLTYWLLATGIGGTLMVISIVMAIAIPETPCCYTWNWIWRILETFLLTTMLVFLRLRTTAGPARSGTSATSGPRPPPPSMYQTDKLGHSKSERSHFDLDERAETSTTNIHSTPSKQQSSSPDTTPTTPQKEGEKSTDPPHPEKEKAASSVPPRVLVSDQDGSGESNPPTPGLKTPPPETHNNEHHLNLLNLRAITPDQYSMNEFKSLSSLTSQVSANSHESQMPLVSHTPVPHELTETEK